MGAWLGLALLKFGNPIILDRMVQAPQGGFEIAFQSWPVSWGYIPLAALVVLGFKVLEFEKKRPNWLFFLPAAWLVWQFFSGSRTVSRELTSPTLWHFTACALCFYLGALALARVRNQYWFWTFLLLAFCYVLLAGFDQHNGGLEETRRVFHQNPDWQKSPPELLKKMESNRIFSTLVYPNALAGVILLLAPPLLFNLCSRSQRWPRVLRGVVVGIVGYFAVACLIWSGSKGGWLVALAMVLVLLLHLDFPKATKTAVVSLVLLAGLAGFFLKFSGYFQKGATSVGARFVYWSAACQTFKDNPVFGTGPGTFSVPFKKIKPPEAEMARLTHNDYLEQASDSGILGFLTYAPIFLASLALLYRHSSKSLASIDFWVWLGLVGWATQGFFEFGLYIPALAWPAFALLGWLWGKKSIEA